MVRGVDPPDAFYWWMCLADGPRVDYDGPKCGLLFCMSWRICPIHTLGSAEYMDKAPYGSRCRYLHF